MTISYRAGIAIAFALIFTPMPVSAYGSFVQPMCRFHLLNPLLATFQCDGSGDIEWRFERFKCSFLRERELAFMEGKKNWKLNARERRALSICHNDGWLARGSL